MKKYISILAILAVAAIACNKVEPQVVEEAPEVVSGTNTVSFSANLPAFGVESKATISDTGDFAWEEGDCIYVLAHSNNNNVDSYWHVAFAYDTATGQFTCNFPVTNYYPGTGNVTLDRVATADEATNAGMAFALYPDPQEFPTEVAYDRVQKLFKMEGSLNAGEIEFEHKSAMVNVHIANVPSFASYFTVARGTEVVKVIKLNGAPSINKAIPITPTGSASEIVITLYDSADNVIISKKKSKALVAGTLYDTPVITVRYILVGIRDFIYGNSDAGTWNLKNNWKVRYWKSGTPDADANLIDLNYTESKSIPGYYSPGDFNMFYTSSVPSDIDGFKVWCDSGGNDWFGEDASPDKTKAYLFEWDYGAQKLAYYE